ncbi:MAG: glycosyl transferase family 2 [Planctomycetaceae bacterium]|nr:glycosyl transferase family 2 [Planctomycetaceae bacterium]
MSFSPNDVTVIIPVINEAGNLRACIESAFSSGASRVIVVDGGSVDESTGIALQSGAKVVMSEPGRGVQQHAGAEAATNPLLCFLHADCLLSVEALAALCDLANSQAEVYACYQQIILAKGMKYRLLEWGNALRVRWLKRPYGDQGICLSLSLYRRLGGFPAVPFMEDVLLAQWMKMENIRPILLPASIEINARRWQQNGVIRQTICNWVLRRKFKRGSTLTELVSLYRRHDQ